MPQGSTGLWIPDFGGMEDVITAADPRLWPLPSTLLDLPLTSWLDTLEYHLETLSTPRTYPDLVTQVF